MSNQMFLAVRKRHNRPNQHQHPSRFRHVVLCV